MRWGIISKLKDNREYTKKTIEWKRNVEEKNICRVQDCRIEESCRAELTGNTLHYITGEMALLMLVHNKTTCP